MNKSIKLQQIETFLMIVKHSSFRKAAKEMNLSPPSLTNAISQLEEAVGVRLLNRSTRSLSLTCAGSELLLKAGPLIEGFYEIIDELNLHKENPGGLIKLNFPVVASDLFFEKIILPFKQKYPGIMIELKTSDNMVNIIESGFDAGVRYYESIPKDMIAIPFGHKLKMVPVASKDFLKKYGRPQHPSELIHFNCINRSFPSGAIYKWEFFDKEIGFFLQKVKGDFVLDTDIAMFKAACAGMGIAYLYEDLVIDKIRSGELEVVLDSYVSAFDGFYLYYPSRKNIPFSLKLLINWIQDYQKSIAG